MTERSFIANIKICGITDAAAAACCAAVGFGAVGFVFYARSPRHMTAAAVRAIVSDLPAGLAKVGVFVDVPAADVLATAEAAMLTTVQFHGDESAACLAAVARAGYGVVKTVRTAEAASRLAPTLPPGARILLECGRGSLPGGNGAVWPWAEARRAGTPVAIAGGLTPENIVAALAESQAAAGDVSSGVERAPGVKDPDAIRRLAAAVTGLTAPRSFWPLPEPRS